MANLVRRLRICVHRQTEPDFGAIRLTASPPFLTYHRPLSHTGFTHKTQSRLFHLIHRGGLSQRERRQWKNELIRDYRQHVCAGTHRSHPLHSAKGRRQLHRDAKRRLRVKRPWPHRLFAKTWRLTFLLVLLAIPSSMVAMFFSEPMLEVNYLDIYNAPAHAITESERAWPLYRDALLSLPRKDGKIEIDFYYGGRPIDPTWPETVHWLNQHSEIVEQLRDATRLPAFGWIANYPGQHSLRDQEFIDVIGGWNPKNLPEFDYRTPHRPLGAWAVSTPTSLHRAILQILAADSWHAAELREPDRVVRNVEALVRLIQQFQYSGNVEDALIASSIRLFLSDSVQEVISTNPRLLDADHYERLARLIKKTASPTWIDPIQALVIVDDVAQRLYTRRGWPTWQGAWIATFGSTGHRNEEPTLRQRLFIAAAAPLIYAGAPSRKSVHKARHRLLHHLRVVANDPSDPRIYLISNTPEDSTAQFREDLGGRFWDGLMANALWPPRPEALLETHRRGESAIDRLRLVVALHRYRSRTGTWPANLWNLTPHELDRIPADPISGGVLGYRLLNGEPLIYSVGADGDDDGGATPLRRAGPHDPPDDPDALYPDHHGARQLPSDYAPDGDWIIYPYPADPPAELPKPYDRDADPYGGGY